MAEAKKKVAILQSNYIPWKGYFDLINSVDEFVLFDDMQYTRRDWRNRNKIKTAQGITWLTIPVQVKGKYFQTIKDTVVSEQTWAQKHWRAIEVNYARADFFKIYGPAFEALYAEVTDETFLSQINFRFISKVCEILGVKTKLSWSSDYETSSGKTERLISICKQAGGTSYLSGPAAKIYLDEALFAREGLEVGYIDYNDYPPYKQLFPPFEHFVSVLDLIFNVGPTATQYMKSFRQ
jgi:hypothetical protein